MRLELVEQHLAKIATAAAALGGVEPLPDSAIQALLAAPREGRHRSRRGSLVDTAAQLLGRQLGAGRRLRTRTASRRADDSARRQPSSPMSCAKRSSARCAATWTAAASLDQLCDALGRDDVPAALDHALAAWTEVRGDALAEVDARALRPPAGSRPVQRREPPQALAGRRGARRSAGHPTSGRIHPPRRAHEGRDDRDRRVREATRKPDAREATRRVDRADAISRTGRRRHLSPGDRDHRARGNPHVEVTALRALAENIPHAR